MTAWSAVAGAAAFGLAAAGGALARAEIGRRGNRDGGFPLGTTLVNVTGAFLLGLLAGVAPPVATVAGTGALGAYTTVSSVAPDAVALAEAGRLRLAVSYVALTCVAGVAAAAAGLALAPWD